MEVIERTCMNQRIVWLHRNSFKQLKSTITVMKELKTPQPDIGVDDFVRSTGSSSSERRCR